MAYAKAFFTKIHPDAKLPTFATKGSAACDLYLVEDVSVCPGCVVLARTGIVAIPPMGYHWELVLRSSIPIKNPGLVLANSIGIIDSDYCGPNDEIKIPLLNTRLSVQSTEDEQDLNVLTFKKGERVGQLILRENLQPIILERFLDELKHFHSSSRGGFGSTGK